VITIGLPEATLGDLRRFLAASHSLLSAAMPPRVELARSGARLRERLAAELRPQAQMVLSLHIPKTAGLTFSRLLAEVFREDFYRTYWEITNCRGEIMPDFPANARCIHGHINPDMLLTRFPSALLVTWVREPVQRLASLYHYWRREPDWRHPLCQTLHEQRLSLLDFARQEAARNEMSRYFGRLRPVDFSFIGIFEDLPTSLERFFQQFDLPPLPISHGHRNPERGSDCYELSASERAEIAMLNSVDEALYRECVARFRREHRAPDR
jgi:hypothetical protein